MDKNNEHQRPLTAQESDEMWASVISRIRDQENKKRKNRLVRLSAVSVAAVLLICCFVVYRLSSAPTSYFAAEHDLTVTLQDKSKVTIYKGGRLVLGRNFPQQTREVFLEGNALFTVSKSKKHPFIVHGTSYETKVLGTVFKVIQRGKSFHVDLFEGKVEVNKRDSPKAIFTLHPKESFSNMGNEKIVTIAPTNKNTAKVNMDATLSFNETQVQEMLSIIETTYGIKVRFPMSIAHTIITLESKDSTAENLLERIAIQLNLKIKKRNDHTFELEE